MARFVAILLLVLSGAQSVQADSTFTSELRSIRVALERDTTGARTFVGALESVISELDQMMVQPRFGEVPLQIDLVVLKPRIGASRFDPTDSVEVDSVRALVARRQYAIAFTSSETVEESIRAPWFNLTENDIEWSLGELVLGCASFPGDHRLRYLLRRARAAFCALSLERWYELERHPGPVLVAVEMPEFPELLTVLRSRGHRVQPYHFSPPPFKRGRARDAKRWSDLDQYAP